MKIIRLATREGRFVVDVYVPPFTLTPYVILWGLRGFGYHHPIKQGPDAHSDRASAEYREVFMYAAVEEVPRP